MKKIYFPLITVLLILNLINFASALVIKSVSMSPNEVSPGGISNIEIELENDGKNDIEDLSVSLDLSDVPFAPYDSSSEIGIDKLRDGRTDYANFKVIVINNAKSGIYKIPVQMKYTESDITKTKSGLISLSVNSKPIVSVASEEGIFIKGQEGTIKIKIVNKGLSDIKFMDVGIGSSNYINLLSPKTQYIGDLDSNDFDSVDFNMYFKDTAPDRISIPITITYKDILNKEYSETTDISVDVYSKEKATQLGLIKTNSLTTIIIIVVVLIIIFIVYRAIRNRIKKKSQNGF
jgi:hypothetical protein